MSMKTLYVLVERQSRRVLTRTDSHVEEIAKSRYAGIRAERDPFGNKPPAQRQVQTALHSLPNMRRITGIPRSEFGGGGGVRENERCKNGPPYAFVHPRDTDHRVGSR